MPVGRSAKKKQRQDKKRAGINLLVKKKLKDSIKKYRAKPGEKLLTAVFNQLDRAANKNIIHSNKASRLKSRLSKLLNNKSKTTTTVKKTSPKKK